MSGAITKKIIAEGAFAENDRYLVIVFDDPAAALQAVKRYERSAQRKDLGYAGAVSYTHLDVYKRHLFFHADHGRQ